MLRQTFKEHNILKYSFTVCIKTNMMLLWGEKGSKMVIDLPFWFSYCFKKIHCHEYILRQHTEHSYIHLFQKSVVDIVLVRQPAQSELIMNNREDKNASATLKCWRYIAVVTFVLRHLYENQSQPTFFSSNMTDKNAHSTIFHSKKNKLYPDRTPQSYMIIIGI